MHIIVTRVRTWIKDNICLKNIQCPSKFNESLFFMNRPDRQFQHHHLSVSISKFLMCFLHIMKYLANQVTNPPAQLIDALNQTRYSVELCQFNLSLSPHPHQLDGGLQWEFSSKSPLFPTTVPFHFIVPLIIVFLFSRPKTTWSHSTKCFIFNHQLMTDLQFSCFLFSKKQPSKCPRYSQRSDFPSQKWTC